MAKNILIDSFGGNFYSALTDNDKLIELHVERVNEKKIVGNIYKGKVENILNGMQAAFVNIGLQKNAYLFVGETLVDKNELENAQMPQTLSIKVGDEIMVQAVKEQMGTKGVRISSNISIAGRYLVYMPKVDFIGISRKIIDEKERTKWEKYIEKIRPKGDGFIVRTASFGVTKKEVKAEADFLVKTFKKVEEKFLTAKVSDIVYEEGDLPIRMIRDVYNNDIDNIVISDKALYNKIIEKYRDKKDNLLSKLVFYDKGVDMLKYYGLTNDMEKLLRNRVDMENGSYLIIDKTEALTVIDVNTGKYIGDKTLEDTVFQTNLISAREIARQVRLRNIGGIIVVDFIDMENEEHRQKVVEELTESLKTDRIKCNVLGMTGLGLVEFTRKKTKRDNGSILLKDCPYCHGEGKIYSDDYMIIKIRTVLLDIFAEGYSSAIIEMNDVLAETIRNSSSLNSDIVNIWSEKRIYVIPHKTYHAEQFTIRGENSNVLHLPTNAKLLY